MKDRMKNPFPAQSLESFFFIHAGYSYDPKKETRKQGRARCASELATAARYARKHDWWYEWEPDWSIGSHRDFYGADSAYADREPDTCESCILRDSNDNVLGSLGCIDDAAVGGYRRVIEAELALEAMHEAEHKRDQVAAVVEAGLDHGEV